jgi:hypothetical protein
MWCDWRFISAVWGYVAPELKKAPRGNRQVHQPKRFGHLSKMR